MMYSHLQRPGNIGCGQLRGVVCQIRAKARCAAITVCYRPTLLADNCMRRVRSWHQMDSVDAVVALDM